MLNSPELAVPVLLAFICTVEVGCDFAKLLGTRNVGRQGQSGAYVFVQH